MTSATPDIAIEDLLALEHQGWVALCSGNGSDFYGELMAADGVMILVNGIIMDRDEVVNSLSAARGWDRYEINDAQMVPLGDRAAVLVYRAVATRDGDPPLSALMASTYRIDGEQLRLAVYQQTTATH